MLAGLAAADVTPPIGSPLNGFIARLAPSSGIDAPLAARALWLEDSQTRLLIVALDVLGVSTAFAGRVVDGVAARLGLLEHQVILTSTHTHSGPMTCRLRGLGAADETYLAVLESRIYEAADAAAKSKRPVQVFWGSAPVEIGVNRREIDCRDGKAVLGCNPDGPRDRMVRVLHLRADDSSIVLFVHASHPYCLGGEHDLISADFPGHAVATLARQGHQAIFLNGCAGDIAPRAAFQGPEAARSEGQRLAEAVLIACAHAQPEKYPQLRVGAIHFALPYDAMPSADTIRAELQQADRTVRSNERANDIVCSRLQSAWNEWLSDLTRVQREGQGLPPQSARISIARIGRGAIVALPGEVFFGIGQRIATRLDADPVCVAAYAHGYIGYVPDREAFAYGGYEVDESHRYVNLWRTSPATEDLLREQVDLLWRRFQPQ